MPLNARENERSIEGAPNASTSTVVLAEVGSLEPVWATSGTDVMLKPG